MIVRKSAAAARGSGAEQMAETTAIPSAPAAAIEAAFEALMPPMATSL
jgi:hypothetical protein